jgi:predicted ATPase
MIKEITLIGFKSFLSRIINLNRLTILAGINNSGKSSIIQALLMLERAANNENSILLEGHGSVEEIKNSYLKEDITLGIENEEEQTFQVKIPNKSTSRNYEIVESQKFQFPEIIYISANRFGPKTSIPIYNDSFKRNRIGANGENLLQCIESFADAPLDARLKHENSEGETLLFNIRGWLSVISPNVEFKYQLNKTSDSSYSMFDEHRATNVGFGLSYALPVITALLLGTIIPNSLVIIENPEAHLHPKAQTEIAKLVSLCTQVGAQIIVETHSDHLFDGIRIAAKQTTDFHKIIQILWFELNERKNTEVYFPEIDEMGRITEWPKGFFDQFETNATKLL